MSPFLNPKYYYNARWYDPSLGKFISVDPSGFNAGDANLYRYVGNSPTNWIDPSGLTWVESDKPFPGATKVGDKYRRYIDDGQSGTVQLKRITWEDIHAEERCLAEQLRGFQKSDGCRCRKYEGGFDSKYFAGEGAQHQYYLVNGQENIYADNEINYIGIGMYEAWLGDSLIKARLIVWAWKVGRWLDVPTAGTMEWMEQGYMDYSSCAPPAPKPAPKPVPMPTPKPEPRR